MENGKWEGFVQERTKCAIQSARHDDSFGVCDFPLSAQCKTITNDLINDGLVSAFLAAFALWECKTAGEHIAKSRTDLSTVRKRLKPGLHSFQTTR
jgi:hypothetical protein